METLNNDPIFSGLFTFKAIGLYFKNYLDIIDAVMAACENGRAADTVEMPCRVK